MEGKNNKTKVFKWAAVLMLAAMMIVGCKQAQGNSSGEEETPADKTYTVDEVSFTMKDIAAVTNGTVGHADKSDNAPALLPIG